VIRASWKLIFVAAAWLFVLGAAGLWLSGRDTRYLNIAAGPLSSESFELSTAIAEVLQETTGNIQVDVFETQGSAENARLLESGQVDMATLQADTPISHGVRALATLYYDAYQLIVRQDSGIHNVADLAGHRIAIPPAASGQNRSFWFLVEHYGIDVDDLVALPMSDDAANFAMHQGQVDAIFRVRAPGNALVNELVRNQGDMRLIAIDQPAALALTVPTIDPGIIPRGSYRGSPAVPVEDTQTAVLDRVLVAREELDEDLVFEVTRILFEQRSPLINKSRLAGLIRPLGEETRIAIPMHAGARRYYEREKPSIIQENSRLMATMLYVGAILTSTFVALRARVKRSRRIRMKDYNLQLMELAEAAENAARGSDLSKVKSRLVEILREVVNDLDAERVTQEEFDHFSFTWQAVDTLVRDRGMAPASLAAQ
jgi:TRAP transporter TAXI family solute receptor